MEKLTPATMAVLALLGSAVDAQAQPVELTDQQLENVTACTDPKGCETVTTNIDEQVRNLINQTSK